LIAPFGALDIKTGNPCGSKGRRNKGQKASNGRRFSRTVRSKETNDLPLLNLKRNVIEAVK
jgi:hypothetical protein